MEKVYILDNLEVKIEMEPVLKMIDCTKDSPVYDDIVQEYREIHQEVLKLAEAVGILGFGVLSETTATKSFPAGTRVLYAVTSIGNKISQYSTRAFQEGEYVRGMLCDAMADNALFSLEGRLLEKLKEVCAEHQVGILKRLEAPHDISMAVQREAWESLNLKGRFGIDISCGFMFDPVKTSCQVFVLTEDESQFKAQHDCRKCPNLTCKLRNIPAPEITVLKGKGANKAFADKIVLGEGESLMDALIREGYYISAVCGGKGRCGKCKVFVAEGNASVSSEDEKFFTPEELQAGWRLSCMLYPEEDLTISFDLDDESGFEVVSEYEDSGQKIAGECWSEDAAYNIAIDIGTTTLAFQLLNKVDGAILHTVTAINNQRRYGADVISRIQASIDGKKEELRESIRKDLREGILNLLEISGVKPELIVKIAIGCNTTMSHLLMGYDCDSLGIYPFKPVNIDLINGSMEDILGMNGDAEVVLLPGISTYVGGDIVAGLYACDFDKSEDICLLVDLGTNGEMALGNSQKILVTSTAAGPAFEGGNITWGMGSVAGAICSVKLCGEETGGKADSKTEVKTIRDAAPVGICGTGVVEVVAEMLREELIDETGLLDEDYFEEGFPLARTAEDREIVLTQKDIRELQLAKAAIRAGTETLVLRYGIQKEQISKVYLAGGFGYRLDTDKAIAIGMLPMEFADRIEAVGNSSLAGAVKYLREEADSESLQSLVQMSEEISLSMDEDFCEAYMNAMMFENL